MAQTSNEEVARYLRHRLREWIKSGHTAIELARLAGVSTALLSQFQSRTTGAGWKTVEGLGRAFGMDMQQTLAASKAYAETNVDTPPVSVVFARDALGRHPDWEKIVLLARALHPEIDARFFVEAAAWTSATGQPEELDVPFVAGLAGALDGLERRTEAVREREERPLKTGEFPTGPAERVRRKRKL